MKSRDGKSQRREEKKKEDQQRESLRRKKIQAREKVGKSRNTMFIQWFVAPVSRKVGSLKWRVRSHLARWEMKDCTSLWREAHFQVKMYKTHQGRMSKKCTPLWREAHFEVKSVKNWRFQSTFGSWNVEKCTPLWWEAHFQVKMCKTHHVQARDCAPCQKWAKYEGFVAVSKTMASVGHLKRIWKDAFRVAGAIQETHEVDVLGDQGGDFLRGVAFWSIRWSVFGRWFCVTGAALRMTWHHFFVADAIL